MWFFFFKEPDNAFIPSTLQDLEFPEHCPLGHTQCANSWLLVNTSFNKKGTNSWLLVNTFFNKRHVLRNNTPHLMQSVHVVIGTDQLSFKQKCIWFYFCNEFYCQWSATLNISQNCQLNQALWEEIKGVNKCRLRHRSESKLAGERCSSNWILTSVNHRGSPQDSKTRVISKCTFLNSSHIYINPLSSQSTKPITSKIYIHKHQTQIFEELIPSILPVPC